MPDLHRILTKGDAGARQMMADIAMGQQHRRHIAMEQRAQKFEQLAAHAMARVIGPQPPRPVGGQRGQHLLDRRLQRAQFARHLRPLRPAPQAPHSRRAADDGDEQVIGVKPPRRQPFAPCLVQPRAEGIRESAPQLRLHPATQDMVIEGKTRRADRPQHRLTHVLAIVQRIAIGGFKHQPVDADHLHQRPVAQRQRGIIDQMRIGQMRARRRLSSVIGRLYGR